MTVPVSQISPDAQSFNWLLNRFASETAGVSEAIAVSSDGLLMAMSSTLDRTEADRLAAITSAIMSLANGASRCYDLGEPNKVIIDLDHGYMLVSMISAGSALGGWRRSRRTSATSPTRWPCSPTVRARC